jgi:hypothetical protein
VLIPRRGGQQQVRGAPLGGNLAAAAQPDPRRLTGV